MFLFLWQSTFKLSDTGLNILLRFFSKFFVVLGQSLQLQPLQDFGKSLPQSVAAGKAKLGTNIDSFTKLVTCPSCNSLYLLEDCIIRQTNGELVSKLCDFIQYPHHPQAKFRRPCGTMLMKTVKTSSGTKALYPRMLYCYKSIIESLQQMLLRPGFIEKCEQWKHRNVSAGCIDDVYDGNIWKEFLTYGGVPFLSAPFNFSLSLNVDWFQPFKNTTYSVGALYIAIQNLPRKERFLSENIILLGVMPGPNEPHLTMNSYLEPLIHDLLQLWNGVTMKLQFSSSTLVRAALLCVTCDIPAARKVCGFVGHNALKACTKCCKTFPTKNFGEKPDYSGFDRSNWMIRTNATHRDSANKYRTCTTRSAQIDIERTYGCRYSVLLQLPYFDPIHMCVIDPMHNLLLGTARRMMSVWKDMGIITQANFTQIQEKVNSFLTPDDVGRIPGKISSGFSSFTAEQWRNWTLIFSSFALKEFLPHQHFQCWLLFVKACHTICRRSIQLEQLEVGDKLILEFCCRFEQLYGKRYCNINLHLHTHIVSCIWDHGPVYAFWLFPFERMNGILGSFHTNSRDVSLQLMRRFLQVNEYSIHQWPNE